MDQKEPTNQDLPKLFPMNATIKAGGLTITKEATLDGGTINMRVKIHHEGVFSQAAIALVMRVVYGT